MFQSKKDHVRQDLISAILSGRHAPGDFLRQNEIAADLGISSTPVREALAELCASGLLEHVPHRGFRVVTCDEPRVRHIYQARRLIEAHTARLATPNIAGSTLAELQALLNVMFNHWRAGRFEMMVQANNAFHRQIFEFSANPFLVDSIERLWLNLPRFLPWNAQGRIDRSLAEHQKIFQALCNADPDAAANAYEEHLDNAQAVFLAQLQRISQAA